MDSSAFASRGTAEEYDFMIPPLAQGRFEFRVEEDQVFPPERTRSRDGYLFLTQVQGAGRE